MIGTCLCRRVTIEVPGPPPYIAICNCDYCRKTGGAIGQFANDTVEITGETRAYVREDMADTWLTLHFCPVCASATHTTGTPQHPTDVIRINMRLFDGRNLAGTEVRFIDGHAVQDEDDPFGVIDTKTYGVGCVF